MRFFVMSTMFFILAVLYVFALVTHLYHKLSAWVKGRLLARPIG